MKQRFLHTVALTLLLIFCVVSPVFAQTRTPPVVDNGGTEVIVDHGGTITPCKDNCPQNNQNTDFKLQVRLENPLAGKASNISEAVKLFMNILLKIALPVIILFFIWAGLKFITALGNPTKLTEARKMFWYTIIGTLLILGAWTITNAIIGTVNSLTS